MKRFSFGLPASLVALLWVPIMHAQTDTPSPADNALKLEKFVTVASTTDRANNVLNPELLAATSPGESALDLLQHLPGVLVSQGDAYGSDDWSTRIYVRGFQAGQLGFSVDGIPNGATNYGGGTKPNRFIDPENVSLVTVSQGSSDVTSAGAQALGGTFDYRTITPAAQAGIYSALTVGDNQARRVFARYSTGQFAGNTTAYVSFSDQTHHRWMNTGSEAGVTTRTHLDAKSVTALDRLTITARYSYDDIFEPNYDSVTLGDYAATPRWDGLTGEWTGHPNDDQNYIKGWNTIRKNSLAAVALGLRASDALTLTAEPYWQHQKGSGGWLPPYWRAGWTAAGAATGDAPFAATQARVFFVGAGGTPLYVGAAPVGVTTYAPANPFDITTYPTAVQAGAKAVQSYRTSTYLFDRIGSTFGGEWKASENNTIKIGGWYENLHREPGRTWHKVLDTAVGWDSNNVPYWSDFLSDLKTKTLSLYAQDTFTIGNLALSGALRKYFVDLSYRDQYGVRTPRSLNSDSGLLPSFGAVYRLGADRGELFGGFSKNFKAIDDNIVASTSALSKSLEPETSNSIDFGYRVTRGHISASVSGYASKFNNRIESITPLTNGGITTINYDIGQGGGYVNVGGIRSKGVEFAVNNALSRRFGASAAITFNRSEYTRSIPENNVVAGNEVTGSPKTMLSTSLFYRDGPYHLSLTGKYTGDRFGTLDNKEVAPAYTVCDATLGYRRRLAPGSAIGAVSVDLRIQNLFDRSYLSGLESDASATEGYYFIGAPRTASLTLAFEF
jgi:iron complex outermembrane receptor protein